MPDSAKNEKQGKGIHIGTMDMQLFANREGHFRDTYSFRLYTKREANTYQHKYEKTTNQEIDCHKTILSPTNEKNEMIKSSLTRPYPETAFSLVDEEEDGRKNAESGADRVAGEE